MSDHMTPVITTGSLDLGRDNANSLTSAGNVSDNNLIRNTKANTWEENTEDNVNDHGIVSSDYDEGDTATVDHEVDNRTVSVSKVHANNIIPEDHDNNTVQEDHDNNTIDKEHGKKTISEDYDNSTIDEEHGNNTISEDYDNNTIDEEHGYNTISEDHDNNTIGEEHGNKTIPEYHDKNTISEDHDNNTIDEEHGNKTIPEDHDNNTIDEEHGNNTIPEDHDSNTISEDHNNNTIDETHGNSTISEDHDNNTINDEHGNNTISEDHDNNTIDEEHGNNTIPDDHDNNTISEEHDNNTIDEKNGNNTISEDYDNNTIDEEHGNNTISEDNDNNTIDEEHDNNTISEDYANSTIQDYHDNNAIHEVLENNSITKNHDNNTIADDHDDNTIPEEYDDYTISEHHGNNSIPDDHDNNTILGDHDKNTIPEEHDNDTNPKDHDNKSIAEDNGNSTISQGHASLSTYLLTDEGDVALPFRKLFSCIKKKVKTKDKLKHQKQMNDKARKSLINPFEQTQQKLLNTKYKDGAIPNNPYIQTLSGGSVCNSSIAKRSTGSLIQSGKTNSERVSADKRAAEDLLSGEHSDSCKNVPPDTSSDPNLYDFSHPHRGYAIIIVNKYFKIFPPRNGANFDVDKTRKTLEKLGYLIINKKRFDLDKKSTLAILQDARDADHSEMDSFALIISSHGNEIINPRNGKKEHVIYCSDDQYIFTGDILEMFSDENIPSLREKPKLFFIQACRGTNVDSGAEIRVTVDDIKQLHRDDHISRFRSHYHGKSVDEETVEPVMISKSESKLTLVCDKSEDDTDARGFVDVSEDKPIVHCNNDCLVMYAIPSGYYAWRSTVDGSWMLHYLWEEVMKYDYRTPCSFLKVLTAVNRKMSDRESDAAGKKAIPVIIHQLDKDIVFQ